MPRALWLLTCLTPLASAACSHGTGHPVHQADGGYSLECTGPLSDCLHHAERLCKDDGYVIAEARDVRYVLGHEAGQSQVVIQSSDAIIYCGITTPRAQIRLQREPETETVISGTAPVGAGAVPGGAGTTPGGGVAATAVVPSAASAKPAAPVCVPGATQACVGPAGCTGGQTCADDGARFGACDCGRAR